MNYSHPLQTESVPTLSLSASTESSTSTTTNSSASATGSASLPSPVTMSNQQPQQQPYDYDAIIPSISKAPSVTAGTETEGDVESGGKKSTPDKYDLPRLVLRNRPFHQSSNKVHIQHNQGVRIYSLLKFNWFHTVLRWPTKYSLLALMVIWTGVILLFAGVYVWYDALDTTISCGLGQIEEPMTFAAAFAFSLETCTTVGYGLPHGINSYFEQGCRSLQIIIYFQMAWSMVFNAFLITFLYSRVGRSESRSAQVICSNKALVSIVDGQVRFQVRLFDADARHPVVEAHVRFYVVMKHRPVPRPLRTLQPDDDMGGMLFLSFPTVVNHHIDLYSLLHPPTTSSLLTTTIQSPSGLVLRQVDGATAGRDDVTCPTCGESYGTLERWKNHVRYQQIVESQDEYPVQGTHLALNLPAIEQLKGLEPTNNLQELQEYFQRNVSEVICCVEGIDPLNSGTFQSLQSYRTEDIVWEANSQFAPCLTVVEPSRRNRNKARMFEVDLDRYHDIEIDPEAIPNVNANTSAPQPKKRHRRVKTLSRRQSDGLFQA